MKKSERKKAFFTKGHNAFKIKITTVKPLYSGHHRDLKKVSAIERCPLRGGSSQIRLFYFKNLLWVLGYSEIYPKVCQKAGFGRRKRLKTLYFKYAIFHSKK